VKKVKVVEEVRQKGAGVALPANTFSHVHKLLKIGLFCVSKLIPFTPRCDKKLHSYPPKISLSIKPITIDPNSLKAAHPPIPF